MLSSILTSLPKEVLSLLHAERERTSAKVSGCSLWAESGSLKLFCGAKQFPHPRKAETGGEDSYFISPNGSSVGVADGVGEWEWRFGVNPKAFADELMAGANEASQRADLPDGPPRDRALAMLEEGYQTTRSFGSATAVVATLGSDSDLGVANLGDSGLRVLRWHSEAEFRGVRIAHRTSEQQHSFNCPYQLSRLPEPKDYERLQAQGQGKLVRAVRSSRESRRQDVPASSDLYSFKVQYGDLILLGTDGLFDNLHDQEICDIAGCALSPLQASADDLATDPDRIAEAIARAARYRSEDSSARTPFGMAAKEAGLHHVGGKADDITVVAAWVVAG